MSNTSKKSKFMSFVIASIVCAICLFGVNPVHAFSLNDIIDFLIQPSKTRDLPVTLTANEVLDEGYCKVTDQKHDYCETVAKTFVGDAAKTVICVTGKSGAAIMTTVSGTTHLPAAAGVGTAYLLNEKVFNGNSSGDQAARVGTYVGAVTGTAVSTGAVLTYGAGASGLATIGGIVGGGMAAGATAIVAAPIAGAVAVGCLFKWLCD